VAEQAVIRGGTALHRLFFNPPGRQSQDIDLVQREPGAIGPLIDEIHAALDPRLRISKWNTGNSCFTLYYRFDTTFRDDVPPLLRTGLAYDPDEVWAWLHDAILTKLPGEQWMGGGGTP